MALVRKHPGNFEGVGWISHRALSEPALPGARLRGQDMTGKCMPTHDLAGSRLLEPLSRTLMGLQLWHKCPGDRCQLKLRLFECSTGAVSGEWLVVSGAGVSGGSPVLHTSDH